MQYPEYLTKYPNWISALDLIKEVSNPAISLFTRKKNAWLKMFPGDMDELKEVGQEDNTIAINGFIQKRLGFLSLEYPVPEDPFKRSETTFRWGDESYCFLVSAIPAEEGEASAAKLTADSTEIRVIEAARLALNYGHLWADEKEIEKANQSLFAIYSQIIYLNKLFQ